MTRRIAVIGDGAWGTALALVLNRKGHAVTVWGPFAEPIGAIRAARENTPFLPGVPLPDSLEWTAEREALRDAETAVLAVPTRYFRDVVSGFAGILPPSCGIVSVAKGLDAASRERMSVVARDLLPCERVAALSGPSHAEEVGRDIPTAIVLAGTDLDLGKCIQVALATPRFRVYLSEDIRGVELCATVKNIIALATGVSDGLGYGDNSRGALITRGLAEMVRFGRVFGVQEKTFFGLSGLGDLVATCTSEHSRNRRVGYRLGQGTTLSEILSDMPMVAEGVYATTVVHEIASKKGVEMPITDAVYRLLYKGADPLDLVEEIMTRAPKKEGA